MAQRQHQQQMFLEAFFGGSNRFPSMWALQPHTQREQSRLYSPGMLLSEHQGAARARSRRWSPQGQNPTTQEGPTGQRILVVRESPAGSGSAAWPWAAGKAQGSSEQPDAESQPRQGSSRSLPQPQGTILPPGEPPQHNRDASAVAESLWCLQAQPRPRALPAPAFDGPKAKPPRSRGEGALCQSRHRLSTQGTCTIFSLIASNQPLNASTDLWLHNPPGFISPLCSARLGPWCFCHQKA